MPCFKGLAVSIHTNDGPISEHSVQKQSRASRISSYIPVPAAKIPPNSTTGKPEQSTFAISITLLTPGQAVPYSAGEPTSDDPYPQPRTVGGLPGYGSERGKYGPSVAPYVSRTTNANETVAAYIFFDGRAKEEVATLLRRGEETWVNSRWVGVPESEGGGLAEREFLFREVGLERWLNGLDLEGSKDKAERIERRQKRLEKKRSKRKEELNSDDEVEDGGMKSNGANGVLRYGGDGESPVEAVATEDDLFISDSDSDDEPPQPEAAGQIKVALFRVIASGDIKRGEYSPQFDAHDDDEGMDGNGDTNGDGGGEEIDHTTSFAKPKQLDPKSISTQTVTGLDPPESPYAVFTFFYRSEKQLRKMNILKTPEAEETPMTSKRKSAALDFSKFGPLETKGTVGFSGYREAASTQRKIKKKDADVDAMDSDADDEDDEPAKNGNEETDVKQQNDSVLSVEDVKRQGELAAGVQKIQLKRQHSAEPLNDAASLRKSSYIKSEESPPTGTPQSIDSTNAEAGTPPVEGLNMFSDPHETLSSPFKRHRTSSQDILGALAAASNDAFAPPPRTSAEQNGVQQTSSTGQTPAAATASAALEVDPKADSDEEL